MVSEWKKNVVRNFDSCAPVYDDHGAVQGKIARSLAEGLPDFTAPDVLEIGCGTGQFTRHLLNKYEGGTFHVTDISPDMVSQARENIGAAEHIDWRVMDGEHPLIDRRYDLIVGNMTVQWFEDVDEAFMNLRRALKPGGVLLYSAPAPACFKDWRAALRALSLPDGMLDFKALPGIFKEEEIIVKYDSTLDFLQSLKGAGARTSRNGYAMLGYADLLRACHMMDERFQGRISWHILYGRLYGL